MKDVPKPTRVLSILPFAALFTFSSYQQHSGWGSVSKSWPEQPFVLQAVRKGTTQLQLEAGLLLVADVGTGWGRPLVRVRQKPADSCVLEVPPITRWTLGSSTRGTRR